MFRFIESICAENNHIRNLSLHQERVNRSRKVILGFSDVLNLEEQLKDIIIPRQGKYKIRVLYSRHIDSVEIIPYYPKRIRSFKLIENNKIDYSFKYEDRKLFAEMKASIDEDEIIIVKDGRITDTSFSNIIFFDGLQWVTPDTYLLNGTMRQSLLSDGTIAEKKITLADLPRFQSIKLINAMLGIDESEIYDLSTIIYP